MKFFCYLSSTLLFSRVFKTIFSINIYEITLSIRPLLRMVILNKIVLSYNFRVVKKAPPESQTLRRFPFDDLAMSFSGGRVVVIVSVCYYNNYYEFDAIRR